MSPAEQASQAKAKKRPWDPTWHCRAKAVRLDLNLTLAEVARAVGLSVGGYHGIESGSDPSLSNAIKIADYFGLRIEQIWEPLA